MWWTEDARRPSARRHDSPARGLKVEDLNPLEQSIARQLESGPRSVRDLAEGAFGSYSPDLGGRVRRALRRVCREGFAHRIKRGVYAPGSGYRPRRR
jgi:hypothetical protein